LRVSCELLAAGEKVLLPYFVHSTGNGEVDRMNKHVNL